MISFSLFIILLIVLFFLSARLKTAIHQFFFSLTKNRFWSLSLFALSFFPGTLLHELSHFAVSVLLFVPVSNLNLIPQILPDNKVRLGSVKIAKVDFLRRTIIGLAPVFVGLAVLWLIFSFSAFNNLPTGSPHGEAGRAGLTLEQSSNASISQSPVYQFTQLPVYRLLFTVYLIFSIINTMFSSKKDIESLIVTVPFFAASGLILYLLGVKIEIAGKFAEVLFSLISQLNLILIFVLIINLAVFLILYLLFKIFKG